jgi:hypothetical protein
MSGKRECVRIKDEERREEGDLRVRHGVKMGRGGYCQKGHRRTVIGDRVSDRISESEVCGLVKEKMSVGSRRGPKSRKASREKVVVEQPKRRMRGREVVERVLERGLGKDGQARKI